MYKYECVFPYICLSDCLFVCLSICLHLCSCLRPWLALSVSPYMQYMYEYKCMCVCTRISMYNHLYIKTITKQPCIG